MYPGIWKIAEIKFVVILMEGCTLTCDLPVVKMLWSVPWEVSSVVCLIKDDTNGNGRGTRECKVASVPLESRFVLKSE